MLRRLQRDFYRITCGFTGAPLILPVLLDNGLTDTAYRMLLTEEFPGWLYVVNLGATTIWERWNSLEPDGTISGTGMNSLNHYAYGSVCKAVYSRIMGLNTEFHLKYGVTAASFPPSLCLAVLNDAKNAAPGWKKALIAPKINGRLREARIRFDSPAGEWRVHWKIEGNGTVSLQAMVPEGASAHVVLPDHPEGFETVVSSGTWEWTWAPRADCLHPFSAESRMMDLMDNDDAAGIVNKYAPALYAACQDHNSETGVMTPVQASYIMHLNGRSFRIWTRL